MIHAPIVIPTLNRYQHFKECLESLENCIGAEYTEVYVALDYPPSDVYIEGWKKIDEYLNFKEKDNRFCRLVVYRRDHNYGITTSVNNASVLIGDVLETHDCYIFTEDDNVFSPCFLEYMNFMLEKFWHDPSISSVSGYNHIGCYDQGKYTYYLSKDNTAWGTGYWRHKEKDLKAILSSPSYFYRALHCRRKAEKIITVYPALYLMLDSMVNANKSWGDVKRTAINIIEGSRQIKPAMSLVRNNGNDGSGVHCGIDDSASAQEISDAAHFDFGIGLNSEETETAKLGLYCQNLPVSAEERAATLKRINTLFVYNTSIIMTIRRKLALRARMGNLFSKCRRYMSGL